jgi:hypothetical protein
MLPPSPWTTLHSRAFRHSGYFLPFDPRPDHVCQNVTDTIKAAEADSSASATKAAAAVEWASNNLNIEMQHQYMLHMLQVR